MDEEEQIEMIADLRRRGIFGDDISGQVANFIGSLLADKARLKKALKPFAEYYFPEDDRLSDDYVQSQCQGKSITLADFRRARAALHGELQ